MDGFVDQRPPAFSRMRHHAGIVRGSPFCAKLSASSFAGRVWLAFFDTS
jgi:hypothetical protein